LPVLEKEEYLPAVCKMCPALCMLEIRVVNGKPVGVAGKPGHPLSQGTICPKGNAILQELYHPDRLRHPIRQKGARGSDQWERISWDEAHQVLRSKLSDLLSRKKADRLAVIAAPIRDIRHELQRRFARVFPTPHFWEWNWPLAEGPVDAFKLMHGSSEGLFYDLANASHIVSFGWDWLQSFPSPLEAQRAYSRLRRGRMERRTRMVQIEPRLSITAAKADDWIRIKPGTEGILALGIANQLLARRLYDESFVSRWTSGFKDFKELVIAEYGPEKVSAATGVEPTKILELARDMASIRPSLAITRRGDLFNQVAVHSLNALLGSIGLQRGVLWSEAEKHKLALPRETPSPAKGGLESVHQLPEAITTGRTNVEVLWLERVNPVFLSPEPQRWRDAMAKIPFIVSFSSFLDESSAMADIVLPPHSSLEAWQYGFSRTLEGNGVVSFAPPIVEPFYETGDHGDFVLKLARSLNSHIASQFPWETFVDALRHAAGRAGVEPLMRQGGWREFKASYATPASAISHPTRKFQFAADKVKKTQPGIKTSTQSLNLHVFIPLALSFGDGAHLPYLHSLVGHHLKEEWETWLEIHPSTAGRLSIKDDQMVWVESSIGKIKAKAKYFVGIDPDTVAMPLGLGHTAMGRYARGIGTNPADLIERHFDASGLPIWHDTKVRVYAA
ncbi:MAG: molybdopterin-dependent oxidoreductase, partial [Elusimicrobia bacterium]|nr:molybdopterin-dependent oxidoreductase [Elusimicrobiota bacterium]